jgi:hypothetical protein
MALAPSCFRFLTQCGVAAILAEAAADAGSRTANGRREPAGLLVSSHDSFIRPHQRAYAHRSPVVHARWRQGLDYDSS